MNDEKKLEQLYAAVNSKHAENQNVARKVATNVVEIGIHLHQIKQLVGHGNFEDALPKRCPKLSDGSRSNYMRLAQEMVIAEHAKHLLPIKSSTVEDLPPSGESVEVIVPDKIESKARDQVISKGWDWLKMPYKFEDLVREIRGKEITEIYREYGIIRQPKTNYQTPRKKLSVLEQENQDRAAAAEDTTAVMAALDVLGARFVHNTEVQNLALTDALQRTLKAVNAWLNQPKNRRDIAEIQKFFH